jgi:hypothetical protein
MDRYFAVYCERQGLDRAEFVSTLNLEKIEDCSLEERKALIESDQKLWIGPTKESDGSDVAGVVTETTELQPSKVLVYDAGIKVFKNIPREGLDGKKYGCIVSEHRLRRNRFQSCQDLNATRGMATSTLHIEQPAGREPIHHCYRV